MAACLHWMQLIAPSCSLGPPVDVITIDHLPTLLPKESSDRYCEDLLPSIKELPKVSYTPTFRGRATPIFRGRATPIFRGRATPIFRGRATPIFRAPVHPKPVA